MKKAEFLAHWRSLPADQPLDPSPVAYRHRGTTFDQDGIRITGSRAFIDAVLSRLKDLLRFEAAQTRLQVMYAPSRDRRTGTETGAHVCYVQVHQRGEEAQMVNAVASAIAGKEVVLSRGS